jgi:hypothetical protein
LNRSISDAENALAGSGGSHDWSGERTPAGFIDPGDARDA